MKIQFDFSITWMDFRGRAAPKPQQTLEYHPTLPPSNQPFKLNDFVENKILTEAVIIHAWKGLSLFTSLFPIEAVIFHMKMTCHETHPQRQMKGEACGAHPARRLKASPASTCCLCLRNLRWGFIPPNTSRQITSYEIFMTTAND